MAVRRLYDPLDSSKEQIRLLRLCPNDASNVTTHENPQAAESNAAAQRAAAVVSAEDSSLHPLLAELIASEEQSVETMVNSEKCGCMKSAFDKPSMTLSSIDLNESAARYKARLIGKSLDEILSLLSDSVGYAQARLKTIQEQSGDELPAEKKEVPTVVSLFESLRWNLEIDKVNSKKYSGSLETVSLQDNHNYVALSYVWGKEDRTFPILLNDNQIEITENLAIALQHIQSPDKITNLWIDALCINQKDTHEKSQQVGIMKDIYEKATSVLVWLGPSSDESDLVMELAIREGPGLVRGGKYNTVTTTVTSGAQIVQKFFQSNPSDTAMRKLCESPRLGKFVLSLRSLLYRQYWYRIWILQELAVGKNVIIACGNKSCPFWIGLSTEGTMSSLLKSPASSPAVYMLQLRRRYQNRISRKLEWMLYYANSLGATDIRLRATNPRDKVYALLGIASDIKLCVTNPGGKVHALLGKASDGEQLAIVVDYSDTVEKVFTDTARAILQYNFDLLLMAQKGGSRGSNSQGMPSWAPDWRLNLKECPSDCSGIDKPFRPYGQAKRVFPYPHKDNSNILNMTGSRVDIVSDAGAILQENQAAQMNSTSFPSVELFLAQLKSFCHRSAALDAQVYGEPKQWLDRALWSIPVGDQEIVSVGGRTRRRLTEASRSGYESLLAFLSIAHSLELSSLDNMIKKEWPKFSIYLSVVYLMAGRRPFLTEKGYVGVGPANLRPGDIVCIFYGAHVPYLIRPESNQQGHFSLVGDAYVHGIMDGEFMEKNAKEEIFELV